VTATAEMPVSPVTNVSKLTVKEQAEADLRTRAEAYVMPKPQKGSAVLWYPHASKTDSPEVGFVWKAGHRNIVVQLIAGTVKETVRHIDDPKLQMGTSQRENGAWDFTDKDKADIKRDEKLAALEAKFTELEDLVSGGKKKKPE